MPGINIDKTGRTREQKSKGKKRKEKKRKEKKTDPPISFVYTHITPCIDEKRKHANHCPPPTKGKDNRHHA